MVTRFRKNGPYTLGLVKTLQNGDPFTFSRNANFVERGKDGERKYVKFKGIEMTYKVYLDNYECVAEEKDDPESNTVAVYHWQCSNIISGYSN